VIEVFWTEAALANFRTIRNYIAEFNPRPADRLAARLIDAGNSLATFPRRGRQNGDIREIIPAYPYIIGYEIVGDRVNILRVRHGMMRS
jgi:toxin ParE1/3/4